MNLTLFSRPMLLLVRRPATPVRWKHNKHFAKKGVRGNGLSHSQREEMRQAHREGRLDQFFLRQANRHGTNEDKGGTAELTGPDTAAHILKGIEAMDKGLVDEAISHLTVALDYQSASAEANCVIGFAYSTKSELRVARRHLELALKSRPKYADAEHGLGLICLGEGNLVSAKQHFTLALEAEPAHLASLTSFGNLLQGEGKYTRAIEFYKQAIAAEPKKAEIATAALGEAYFQLGDVLAAVEWLKKCLRQAPLYGPAHLSLAAVYVSLKRYRDAREHIDRVLEIAAAPERTTVQAGKSLKERIAGFLNLILSQAQVAVDESRFTDTERLGELAVHLSPHDKRTHQLLAAAHVRQGKLDLAEARYLDLLATHGDDFETLLAMSSIMAKTQRQVDAMNYIMRLQACDPERARAFMSGVPQASS
eukprot:TRINITY_DN945_c0_g1_i1.p1 TRINITY_DN945_c0_g1~~TRINITY_DN945_c0_g1_i1.p1  ORF type:complete len:429 (+),score=52.78 TRINITY_DN945_c0_g1_i1:24-1289(+)